MGAPPLMKTPKIGRGSVAPFGDRKRRHWSAITTSHHNSIKTDTYTSLRSKSSPVVIVCLSACMSANHAQTNRQIAPDPHILWIVIIVENDHRRIRNFLEKKKEFVTPTPTRPHWSERACQRQVCVDPGVGDALTPWKYVGGVRVCFDP